MRHAAETTLKERRVLLAERSGVSAGGYLRRVPAPVDAGYVAAAIIDLAWLIGIAKPTS